MRCERCLQKAITSIVQTLPPRHPPGAPAGEERAVVVARLVAEIRSQPVGTAAAVEQAVVRFSLISPSRSSSLRYGRHPGRCGEILQRLRRSSAIGARAVFTLLFMIAGSGLLSRRDAQAAEPGDGAKLSGGRDRARQGRDAGHRHSGLPGPGGRSRRASRGGADTRTLRADLEMLLREAKEAGVAPDPALAPEPASAGVGSPAAGAAPDGSAIGEGGFGVGDALFLTAAPVGPAPAAAAEPAPLDGFVVKPAEAEAQPSSGGAPVGSSGGSSRQIDPAARSALESEPDGAPSESWLRPAEDYDHRGLRLVGCRGKPAVRHGRRRSDGGRCGRRPAGRWRRQRRPARRRRRRRAGGG